MTAHERKALTAWNIEITAERSKRDECFKSLQALCQKYEMHAYCSAHANLSQLLTNSNISGPDSDKAIDLFDKFCRYTGRAEALSDLISNL